jgi:hypothetical protein
LEGDRGNAAIGVGATGCGLAGAVRDFLAGLKPIERDFARLRWIAGEMFDFRFPMGRSRLAGRSSAVEFEIRELRLGGGSVESREFMAME